MVKARTNKNVSKPSFSPAFSVRKRNEPPIASNVVFTKDTLNSVESYLDNHVPSWRTGLMGDPRTVAIDFARQAGVSGLVAILNWAANNTPEIKLPKLGGGSTNNTNNSNNNSNNSNRDNDLVSPGGKIFTTSSQPIFALSPAPTPKSVSLRTGIQPDTYVNDYSVPIENSCACMHVSVATLQMPTLATSASNPLSTYFEKGILFDIVTKLQEAVPFGVDTSVFTSANLATAFNSAIYALQVYFYYSSIISYESDSRNKNSGMVQLRSLIDAATITSYVQLGKRLEDLPIPKRIVEWVRFMSGNYYSGATPGSPIIKIVPSQAVLLGATNTAETALTALTSDTNTKIWSIMRKAFPKWRVGKLYDLPTTPIYNLNFKTIFSNLENGNRATGSSVYYNTAANANTNISYNTFTNNLDGLAFSMTSYYDTTAGCHIPGLCQTGVANATYVDTRYSYYSVSGNKNFYPVMNYPFLALSRDESNIQIGTTAYYPHIYGSDRCQGVTGNSLLQSAQSVLDFLFEASSSYKSYIKSARVYEAI